MHELAGFTLGLSRCLQAMLAADAPTMTDWISALSSLLGAVLVVPFGLYQIFQQLKQSREQEQRQATLSVCQRYESADLQEAMKTVLVASVSGRDYTKIEKDNKGLVKFAACRLLNYLQGIAIGIEEGLYSESMVRKYLEPTVRKALNSLVLGVSEQGYQGAKVFPEEDFDALCRLYRKWFSSTS